MTDLEILGLHEPFTNDELKSAYRKKCKLFHPDRNRDNLNSHLAMIRLNRAYSSLLNKVNGKTGQNEKSPVKDTVYPIYKKAIETFQKIHPSQWKTCSREGLFDPGGISTHPEAASIIQTQITRLAEAYHDFSIIVSGHRGSPWYADSLRRMREIEKLTERYIKIKESYEKESLS